MGQKYAILIPSAKRDDIKDTVDSVLHFEPDLLVVVVKDFDEDLVLDSRVTVLPPLPWVRNGFGAIFQKKIWAIDFILQNTEVETILSLDADALILRSGVFPKVSQVFLDPSIGIAGCCRITPSGGTRNFEAIGRSLQNRGGLRSLGQLKARSFVGELLARASTTNYVLGVHALGGAQFFKREMLSHWKSLGWLGDFGISKLNIAEDGLFGLMAYASGYGIADIGGPGGLLNIAWKGLPSSPNQICDSGAYATHSVRSFENMNETQIRGYFKERRTKSQSATEF
jgi:hypothetical protein